MKVTLFMNVLLASMLVVAVGCGKDKKKKNPYDAYYNPYSYYNPYGSGQQPSATGAQAQAALQNYINGVDANQSIFGPVLVSKAKYSCGDLWGIDFIQTCRNKSAPSETVQVIPGQTRGMNHPALGQVFTSPAGYTPGSIVQYGNIILVQHVKGSYIIEYAVDVNRHSAVNPVQVKDTELQKIEYVTGPQI